MGQNENRRILEWGAESDILGVVGHPLHHLSMGIPVLEKHVFTEYLLRQLKFKYCNIA